MTPQLIDTHAHLFHEDYADRLDQVLQRAEETGIGAIICVGLDLPTSEQAVTIAETYPKVWAAVGIHPHDAEDAPPEALHNLESLATHNKVVAIGETGLDYVRNQSPPEVQRALFQGQLELARSLDLPVVVHNRRADDDLLATMQAAGHAKGVLHCFSSTPEFARIAIDFGFHISFTGTVTYGKNRNESVLKAVGLERVMVETDCPYLAPVPHRGKANEPAFVRHVAEKIAGICGTTLEEVTRTTTANAQELFRLPNGSSG
ncbi:MAG: TatD family hydrolase [Fidelibacterota bacterium]|nr:MAG: TatD family hydrolase [Candidatus Neomarinimicrobiota bacterium]